MKFLKKVLDRSYFSVIIWGSERKLLKAEKQNAKPS